MNKIFIHLFIHSHTKERGTSSSFLPIAELLVKVVYNFAGRRTSFTLYTDRLIDVRQLLVKMSNSISPTATAKKTTEWVLNKAGVKRELLDTVKARKLATVVTP